MTPSIPLRDERAPPALGRTAAVCLLASMNFLNFIDRYAPSAMKDLFKADLRLSDEQTGLVFSAFVLVFMVACPVFGTLAERGRRPRLLAFGVLVWSVATAAGAVAWDFGSLLCARALVGIGEAAFITITPTLVADLYPPARRTKILTLLNATTPVGVAVGFGVAGFLGELWGWRAGFAIVGLPGALLAAGALFLPDPPRGNMDSSSSSSSASAEAALPWRRVLAALAQNPRYLVATGGYIAITFALGGIGDWLPTFLSRERGFGMGEAGTVAGLSVVAGGLLGTLLGGTLASVLRPRFRESLFLVCGLACIPGFALAAWGIFSASGKTEIALSLAAAQVFLWMYNGPVSVLLVNALHAGLRARAFGLALLATHLLGDVISPPIIGRVSTLTGSVAQAIGVALAAVLLASVIWLFGAFARLRGAPG